MGELALHSMRRPAAPSLLAPKTVPIEATPIHKAPKKSSSGRNCVSSILLHRNNFALGYDINLLFFRNSGITHRNVNLVI